MAASAQVKPIQEKTTSEKLDEILGILTRIMTEGIPVKVLLKPEEAARALGFSESATNQADWMKEIPVVKVGIKNRYRLCDLQAFADNHVTKPLR